MSVKRYDFVIFLSVDWDTKIQKNRQHFLVAELARQCEGRSKILGVERPICPWTSPFRKREKFIQWLHDKRGVRQVGPNLYLCTPFVFIHNIIAARMPGVTALNRRLLRTLLRQVLKRAGFRTDNLIAWLHHPYQLEDEGLVGEKGLVYDCYDDYMASELNPVRQCDLEQRERAILKRANWVFVASEGLWRIKGKIHNSVHLVTNGVEFEHFAQAAREDENVVVHNDRPVLGFTGKITPRLDFQLLVRLTTAHPDWKLVMIGPQERDSELIHNPAYREFITISNVHLAGAKPYQELPLYMRPFDVCLLPYTTNDPFNVNCSPLKLYEYLATGKPIVSTDLPAVRSFDDLVHIARDADEFEQHVAEVLEERDEDLCQKRLATARDNSWDRRAKMVLQILESTLEEKRS